MKKFFIMVVTAILFSVTAVWGDESINGAGATFATPVYQAWAYDYNKAFPVKVNYQSIGSGGGIRQIIERTVDFGASDNPMPPADLKKFGLLQFPTLIGGVVLVVNIDGIKDGQLRLDSQDVCRIYLGDIKYWDDPAIKALNPSLKLPHGAISVVYRADGSGTTSIFTNYLAGTCADFKTRVGQGTSVKWPLGIGGKGNEGVTSYVKRSKNSIGYVQFAYAKQNGLTYTQMKNKAGNFVEPDFETFEAAANAGEFDPQKDFFVWLNNAPDKNAWPITGATFILLARDKTHADIMTVRFFDWAFRNRDAVAKKLGYVPLGNSLKKKIAEYWKANGIY